MERVVSSTTSLGDGKNDSGWIDAFDTIGDVVPQEDHRTYDDNGNLILRRPSNGTTTLPGTGPLGRHGQRHRCPREPHRVLSTTRPIA